MSDPRRRMGQAAEDLAAKRLEAAGWRVIDRNSRTRQGEIDIIAAVGDRLVFVEVKAGRQNSFAGPERPALAVGPQKRQRLRRLAGAWLTANGAPSGCREFRFDVIGITYDREGRVTDYDHIENAF